MNSQCAGISISGGKICMKKGGEICQTGNNCDIIYVNNNVDYFKNFKYFKQMGWVDPNKLTCKVPAEYQ